MLLETLYIDQDGDYCLCPVGRYAKMPNVWFIPTLSVLKYWLERVGFDEIKVISCTITEEDEQRSTALAPGESLGQFLSAQESRHTVEGYPRPRRVIFSAWKP